MLQDFPPKKNENNFSTYLRAALWELNEVTGTVQAKYSRIVIYDNDEGKMGIKKRSPERGETFGLVFQ